MSAAVIAETVRRHFRSVGYWTFLALIVIVSFGTARFHAPASGWPTLVSLLAIVTGSALIGPEFSTGTLQLILVKPVRRAAYLLSRVTGVVLVVFMASMAGAGAELLGRALLTEAVPAKRIAVALLNTTGEVALIAALLTLAGSFTRAYFNVALYLVVQVSLGIAAGVLSVGRRFPVVLNVLEEVSGNLYPDAPPTLDARWLLLVASNAAVALVLACLIFRRREVPYGAD